MTAPKRQPARRVSKAERRAHLLAQAKALFLLDGYRVTTTARIAEAAGVSEAVLSRHFATKEAFFLDILHEIRQATLDRWSAETAGGGDPLARLHAIADLYLEVARERAGEVRLLHRTLLEQQDETILGPVRDFYLEVETLLARLIAEGQQSGVFRRSLDPRVGAWELIRTISGCVNEGSSPSLWPKRR